MSREKRILIVEGPNDAHVVLSLMGANNIHAEFRNYRTPHFSNEESLEIREKGGIVQAQNFENLLESLAIEVKAASDGFLGVVVDANSSLENRWRSLRDRLRSDSIGYDNVSALPEAEGLVLERREFLPKFGVWVMPNNQLPGKIEDFVRLLVAPERENLWSLAEQTLNTIPAEDKLFAAKDKIKAHVHTFLAWQDEPGKPMGLAITQRYFQPEAQEATNFVGWIKRLFEIP